MDYEKLDEIVHEAASEAASDALNAGEGEEFLLMLGWSRDEINESLEALELLERARCVLHDDIERGA